MSRGDWAGRAWLALWHMPGRIGAAMLRVGTAAFWAKVGAAQAQTLVLVLFGGVIWLGPWPEARAEQQLNWLGVGMLASAVLALVALASITEVRAGITASRDGLKVDVEHDDDTGRTSVTATTGEPPENAPKGG